MKNKKRTNPYLIGAVIAIVVAVIFAVLGNMTENSQDMAAIIIVVIMGSIVFGTIIKILRDD